MAAKSKLDVRLFANDVLITCWQRGGLSLRDVGRRLDLSASTMSRITKHGEAPDLRSYALLCMWMGVPLSSYVLAEPTEAPDGPHSSVRSQRE